MTNKEPIIVSPLNKTWILDLDGTIVKHNGYKIDGHDTFLEGAKEFLENISVDDMIIFLTSRKKVECGQQTEEFLRQNKIRYHHIIWDAPYGERILMNDKKPSGLYTSIAVNTERDEFFTGKFKVNEML